MKRAGANKISRSFPSWCAHKNAECGTRLAERCFGGGFTRPIDRDREFCSAFRLLKTLDCQTGERRSRFGHSMTIGGCAACGARERSSAHQTTGVKDLYPLVELKGSTRNFDSSWPFLGAASGAPSEFEATQRLLIGTTRQPGTRNL